MNIKTKLILSALAVMVFSTVSHASVTRQELQSGEFLINNGFSEETARLVDVKSKKYHDVQPASESKFINTMWKIDKYFDPMYDDPTFGISQNIKFNNNETKLLPGYEKHYNKTKLKKEMRGTSESL